MTYEAGSEFLSSNGNIGDMNLLGIGSSAFASNLGAELIGNKYSLSFNNGFEKYNFEETALNFTVGRVNSGIKGNLKKFSNLLGSSGSVEAITISLTLAGQTGTKSLNNYGILDK